MWSNLYQRQFIRCLYNVSIMDFQILSIWSQNNGIKFNWLTWSRLISECSHNLMIFLYPMKWNGDQILYLNFLRVICSLIGTTLMLFHCQYRFENLFILTLSLPLDFNQFSIFCPLYKRGIQWKAFR